MTKPLEWHSFIKFVIGENYHLLRGQMGANQRSRRGNFRHISRFRIAVREDNTGAKIKIAQT